MPFFFLLLLIWFNFFFLLHSQVRGHAGANAHTRSLREHETTNNADKAKNIKTSTNTQHIDNDSDDCDNDDRHFHTVNSSLSSSWKLSAAQIGDAYTAFFFVFVSCHVFSLYRNLQCWKRVAFGFISIYIRFSSNRKQHTERKNIHAGSSSPSSFSA